MRLMATILIIGMLTGCAADPAKVQAVADAEASYLAPPARPLSSYAEFELADMAMGEAILIEEGKVEEAREFEANLQAKLNPLLATWNAAPSEGASGTLSIETTMRRLKIVSGGARFWAGAWAGDSFIDLNLQLVDKASGEIIADVPIRRSADSMTGAWSVGKSDQNLDEYIVSIIHEYLNDNY